jgi:hypothetical protein
MGVRSRTLILPFFAVTGGLEQVVSNAVEFGCVLNHHFRPVSFGDELKGFSLLSKNSASSN